MKFLVVLESEHYGDSDLIASSKELLLFNAKDEQDLKEKIFHEMFFEATGEPRFEDIHGEIVVEIDQVDFSNYPRLKSKDDGVELYSSYMNEIDGVNVFKNTLNTVSKKLLSYHEIEELPEYLIDVVKVIRD